jgi:hypothetical protein
MRNYIFIFQDNQQNELKRTEATAKNMKQAKELAKKVLANSMINDLHKIEVKPSTKILKITFENYYSNLQSVYVVGTYNQSKAIKAVREDQAPRQFKYISCEVIGENELSDFDLDYLIEL